MRVLLRNDDANRTGAMSVIPRQVQNALDSHPRVLDSAVFGEQDERLGQRVVAAVVAAHGNAPPTLAELRIHVKTILDPTAAPREVHFVDELPRRGIGKVDRRKLAARFST